MLIRICFFILISTLVFCAHVPDINMSQSENLYIEEKNAPDLREYYNAISELYKYKKAKDKAYKKSFHTHYEADDYNDTHILFYKEELESASYRFMKANDEYELFEADVTKDLALGCIEYYLIEHKQKDWISARSSYRKNARNLSAKTDVKIENTMKNERLMDKNFYLYDLNLVNSEIDNIVSKRKNSKNNPCLKNITTKELYSTFLIQYVLKFNGTQERHTKWLELIHEKHPLLKGRIKEYQEKIALENKKVFENKEAVKREKAPKKFYVAAVSKSAWMDISYFNKYGVDLNMRFENGKTALMLALENNNTNAISKLLLARVDLSLKDDNGRTVWDYINKNHMSYAQMKILEVRQKGDNSNCKRGTGNYDIKTDKAIFTCLDISRSQWSPLALAIMKHKNKEVKQYIEKKQYLNVLTNIGSTPIFVAIVYDNKDALDLLIASGANLEIKNKQKNSPLSLAVRVENIYAVKKLLENGVNIYGTGPYEDETVFSYAIDRNYIEIVELFIKMGIDVNYQHASSTPVLSVATYYNCKKIEIFELLLKNGATPFLVNGRNQTTIEVLKDRCSNVKRYEEHLALLKRYNNKI